MSGDSSEAKLEAGLAGHGRARGQQSSSQPTHNIGLEKTKPELALEAELKEVSPRRPIGRAGSRGQGAGPSTAGRCAGGVPSHLI